jgi:hypothetical protein
MGPLPGECWQANSRSVAVASVAGLDSRESSGARGTASGHTNFQEMATMSDGYEYRDCGFDQGWDYNDCYKPRHRRHHRRYDNCWDYSPSYCN